MSESTPSTTADAMLALANQVEKLSLEMMAIRYFVAAIPTAGDHLPDIRHALNERKASDQSEHHRIDAVHRALDELDGLAGEFRSMRRSG